MQKMRIKEAYQHGRTPSLCIGCFETVKKGALNGERGFSHFIHVVDVGASALLNRLSFVSRDQ